MEQMSIVGEVTRAPVGKADKSYILTCGIDK